MSGLQVVTDENFEEMVYRAGQPVLVDFTSEHCGPCRAMVPTLAALAQEFDGKAKILALDVHESPKFSDALGIRATPTFVLFDGETVLYRQCGATSRTSLWNAISDTLEAR